MLGWFPHVFPAVSHFYLIALYALLFNWYTISSLCRTHHYHWRRSLHCYLLRCRTVCSAWFSHEPSVLPSLVPKVKNQVGYQPRYILRTPAKVHQIISLKAYCRVICPSPQARAPFSPAWKIICHLRVFSRVGLFQWAWVLCFANGWYCHECHCILG